MKKTFINITIAIVDLIVLVCIFYIASLIRANLPLDIAPAFKPIAFKDFFFIIVIVYMLMIYEKIYRFRYDFWQDTLQVIKALFIGYIIALAILSLSKVNLEYSRLFITIYFILALFILPITKRVVKMFLFKSNLANRTKALIVGAKDECDRFRVELQDNWYLGMIDDKDDFESVFIISKGLSLDTLNSLITQYTQQTTEVFVVPFITQINFAHSHILEYSNLRNSAIHIENRLLIKSNIIIKNSFDMMASLCIIPFVSIIHIIIATAIKLDDGGKVFFKQKRLGKDGKVFEVYKYRTMYSNSDELLANYLQQHPNEIEYYNKYHKYINDPRITKVGKILRASSLDELPQILNVVLGDMSLVGPRPYMIEEEALLKEHKEFILKVKPGITGLWQVSGRNNLTFKERNELESWYIKNWSLWFDFVIIIKTIKVVLSKVGAR